MTQHTESSVVAPNVPISSETQVHPERKESEALQVFEEKSSVHSEVAKSDRTDSKDKIVKEENTSSKEKKKEKIILPIGKTLRLLALDLYGDKEFWVYIYLENKDVIPNPHRVPSGIELRLPDKRACSIDATDIQSISKARSLSREVLGSL